MLPLMAARWIPSAVVPRWVSCRSPASALRPTRARHRLTVVAAAGLCALAGRRPGD